MVDRLRDPLRQQLDERWNQYLRTHQRPAGHAAWMDAALANYRAEIVHYGAQLLNDCVIRPWDEHAASASFERYRTTATEYDRDPEAWERSFWLKFKDELPVALRSKWADRTRRGEGDESRTT